MSDPRSGPRPIDWFVISGRERLMAWQGLAQFVETLVFHYNMQREVRPCWWRHQDAVEELTALWHTRQVLYGPDATLSNAMSWLNTFYNSRERLGFMFVACGDFHVDSKIATWMTDDDRKAFIEGVKQDVLGHDQ